MTSLGRIAYRLWFEPLGMVRKSLREGGPIEQRHTRIGREAMREAAKTMAPLAAPPAGPDAEVAYLSGARFWDQTLLCFVSLQKVCPFRVIPVIHDDGSLDATAEAKIRRVVPWARIEHAEQIRARLDMALPESRFPSLRARRLVYPHLRKLTDIHAGIAKPTLVADSDMLFFKRPDALLDWFVAPHPLYMRDVETAYGYPLDVLDRLAGAPVPPAVNVGLYALDSAAIDWERVEQWCAAQLADHGSHYLQEQALTAMLFAGQEAAALSRVDYVVMPDEVEAAAPRGVLHHYVALSKKHYFRHNWRSVLG